MARFVILLKAATAACLQVGNGVALVEKATKEATRHLAEIEKALEHVVKNWKKTGICRLGTFDW